MGAWLPDHIWLAQKAAKKGGSKGVKGKGKRKSTGWLPDHIWLAQKLGRGASKGKGFGKGKGRGKGKRKGINKKKEEGKIVWIGGLKEKETKDTELEKELYEFIKGKVEGCKWVEIGRKGTALAIFGTGEEAASAISVLNGIKFKKQVLEFDVWTKAEEAEE